MRGPTLRLVCINDVYALDNLPRIRTLVQRQATVDPADLFLTTMAGDFVAPSLLSSLDKGFGMVDCLNAIPITHAIFGNHEDDVPFDALCARIRQFRGTWINTNIPGFAVPLPAHQVLTVVGPGTRAVRVGLVGVLTNTANLYRPGAFGGAKILDANPAALARARALVREAGCACVIPLTHQSVADDRALAVAERDPPFPVVIGGHDHEVHLERLDDTWIVKAGSEAAHAVVVDLIWPAAAPADGAPDLPKVVVRLEHARDYAEDPELRARVDRHMQAVRELEAATLLRLAPGERLSSVGTRQQQTSVGALICSRVRDVLGVDACVINGGGIRAGRDYDAAFTFGDLETELPFPNEVVSVAMPGRVLREAVAVSRARAPEAYAGFLQVDDGVTVAAPGNVVTAVGGAPLDDAREYRVATVRVLFDGMDNVEPLVRFAREHPERVPPRESGRELKTVFVAACALELWQRLGTFEQLDTNHDDNLDAEEIRVAIARVTEASPPALLVDQVIQALDTDHDKRISRAEAARVAARRESGGHEPGGSDGG